MQQRKTKVLYIQHAGAMGGSVMSLLYTIEGLRGDHGVEPILLLVRPTEELLAFYRGHGIETHPWPGILTFEHTTLAWGGIHSPRTLWSNLWSLANWRKSMQRTLDAVDRFKPDLVHLNSVVLPASASALKSAGVRFVWHVREPPVSGYVGLRRRWISNKLQRLTPHTIFISNYDRDAWVGPDHGNVVHNFVDLGKFRPSGQGESIRAHLGIGAGTTVISYLGGIAEVKGVFELVEALRRLQTRCSDFVCLMFACAPRPAASWKGRLARHVLPWLGLPPDTVRFAEAVRRAKLGDRIRLIDFKASIIPWLDASDVLVFPSILPHFARPIVEASAMGKAVIGSNLGGVSELVEHEKTGLLVKPRSPAALQEAMLRLIQHRSLRVAYGKNGMAMARANFSSEAQIDKIAFVYSRAFKGK